jgi:hypothetical protein
MEVSAFETSPTKKEDQLLGFGSFSLYEIVKSYYPAIDGEIDDEIDGDAVHFYSI